MSQLQRRRVSVVELPNSPRRKQSGGIVLPNLNEIKDNDEMASSRAPNGARMQRRQSAVVYGSADAALFIAGLHLAGTVTRATTPGVRWHGPFDERHFSISKNREELTCELQRCLRQLQEQKGPLSFHSIVFTLLLEALDAAEKIDDDEAKDAKDASDELRHLVIKVVKVFIFKSYFSPQRCNMDFVEHNMRKVLSEGLYDRKVRDVIIHNIDRQVPNSYKYCRTLNFPYPMRFLELPPRGLNFSYIRHDMHIGDFESGVDPDSGLFNLEDKFRHHSEFMGPRIMWWWPDFEPDAVPKTSTYGHIAIVLKFEDFLSQLYPEEKGGHRLWLLGTRVFPREIRHSILLAPSSWDYAPCLQEVILTCEHNSCNENAERSNSLINRSISNNSDCHTDEEVRGLIRKKGQNWILACHDKDTYGLYSPSNPWVLASTDRPSYFYTLDFACVAEDDKLSSLKLRFPWCNRSVEETHLTVPARVFCADHQKTDDMRNMCATSSRHFGSFECRMPGSASMEKTLESVRSKLRLIACGELLNNKVCSHTTQDQDIDCFETENKPAVNNEEGCSRDTTTEGGKVTDDSDYSVE